MTYWEVHFLLNTRPRAFFCAFTIRAAHGYGMSQHRPYSLVEKVR